MTTAVLADLHRLMIKIKTVIETINIEKKIVLYKKELSFKPNESGFIILPVRINPREKTGQLSLVDMEVVIFCYKMFGSGESEVEYETFNDKIDDLIAKLLQKANLPSGFSTVNIIVDYDDPFIEQEKLISLTLKCEYKKFATR